MRSSVVPERNPLSREWESVRVCNLLPPPAESVFSSFFDFRSCDR